MFLEREALPALFRRLPQALPHEGWRPRKDGGWRSATGTECLDPFEVLEGRRTVQWLARLNGGSRPVGIQVIAVAKKVAGLAGVPFPDRQPGAEELREVEVAYRRRQALEALLGATARLLESREAAGWATRLAARGLDTAATRALGLGFYPSEVEVRQAIPPDDHRLVRDVGLLAERFAGCLLVPWRDPWRRELGFSLVRPDWTVEPIAVDPLAWSYPLLLERAHAAGAKDLLLLEDWLTAAVLQSRGETRAVASPSFPLSSDQRAGLRAAGILGLTVCLSDLADRRLQGLDELGRAGVAVYVAERPVEFPGAAPRQAATALLQRPRTLAEHRLERLLVGVSRESSRAERDRAVVAAGELLGSMPEQLSPVQTEDLIHRLAAATGEKPAWVRRLLGPQRPRPSEEYRAGQDGLHLVRWEGGREQAVQLANFDCRLLAEVVEDDGKREEELLELETEFRGEVRRFRIPADQLRGLRWVHSMVSPLADVKARAQLVESLHRRCSSPPRRRVHAHLGWCELEGRPIYVHAGGALGGSGVDAAIEVRIDPPFDRFLLPPVLQATELVAAIRASLSLLDLAPRSITVPACAAVWQAAIARGEGPRLRLAGDRVAQAALAELLSAHWGGAAHAIELQELRAAGGRGWRGVLVAIAANDQTRTERWREAPLKGPCVLFGARPCGERCLVLGHSTLDQARLHRARADAAEGKLAQAMAGFVSWWAGPQGGCRNEPGARAGEERDGLAGLRAFVAFARSAGAIDAEAARSLLAFTCEDPLDRALELLRDAFSEGRAHLASPDGTPPEVDPGSCGWRRRPAPDGPWSPGGPCLGWLKGGGLLLEPNAAHAFLVETAGAEGLPEDPRELGRLLAKAGLLTRGTPSRNTHCVRLTTSRGRPSVLPLLPSTLLLLPSVPALADPGRLEETSGREGVA